jgi:diphthamide biosynthesis protein 2
VHNVGLSSSHALLTRLRALLTKKRRKSYTISVGRLNPAKLGNFEVVECWVLIGCREGGLVDNKVRSGNAFSLFCPLSKLIEPVG